MTPLFTLPSATTTLSGIADYSGNTFLAFLPLVYLLAGVVIGALVFVAVMPAEASIVVPLDVISSSSIGSGTSGYVTLTQDGADKVDVDVSLAANTAFVSTGGPHHAFAYNLDLKTPFSVTIENPARFSVAKSSFGKAPFGLFTDGINCPGCGPGASHAKPGTLDFFIYDASGISISDFVANAKGYYFSADVIGPRGGTGNIAAVPLPAALPMMGAGLLGLCVLKRRSARKDA